MRPIIVASDDRCVHAVKLNKAEHEAVKGAMLEFEFKALFWDEVLNKLVDDVERGQPIDFLVTRSKSRPITMLVDRKVDKRIRSLAKKEGVPMASLNYTAVVRYLREKGLI